MLYNGKNGLNRRHSVGPASFLESSRRYFRTKIIQNSANSEPVDTGQVSVGGKSLVSPPLVDKLFAVNSVGRFRFLYVYPQRLGSDNHLIVLSTEPWLNAFYGMRGHALRVQVLSS